MLDRYPHIGRIRFSFARPPEVSDIAVEPIGSVDVTALPGVGAWVRGVLQESLGSNMCLPHWVEVDMRTKAAAGSAFETCIALQAPPYAYGHY